MLHLTTSGRERRDRTLRYAEIGSPPILFAGVAVVPKPPWITGDLGLLMGDVAGPTSGILSCDAISSSWLVDQGWLVGIEQTYIEPLLGGTTYQKTREKLASSAKRPLVI